MRKSNDDYGEYVVITGYNGTSTDVVIPSEIKGYSVLIVDENAFKDCNNLISVDIQSGITNIGKGAFSGCSNLESVSIPRSMIAIDEQAFFGCSSMTSIEIPSDLAYIIGSQVFEGCSNLTIYCEAESQSEYWDSNWNCDRPVVWGHTIK